jgi:tetratricopeptide (TPR) repeat protein/GT2 family glycosyltransferase
VAPHAVIVIDPSAPGAPDLGDGAPVAVRDDPASVIERTNAEVVVVVQGDIVLPEGWLAAVLAPFADPWVAAVGPMLTAGPPAQDAGNGRDERTASEEAVHAALRLDARCWAVRAPAARAVGGLRTLPALVGMEVDDLCRRLAAAGHNIRVAEGVCADVGAAAATERAEAITMEIAHLARVSAAARDEQPLVSAALIVKDEEENLPACLASLSGLVDEVVVYDTGSTDRSVEIARAAGATVVEGYWDDDFSRARNEALARCTGEWVLSIDADEVATGNPAAIRTALEVNWGVDVLVVQITNVFGPAGTARPGLDHFGPRLLRRSRCRWRLRLHEQPVTPDGDAPMRGGKVSHLRLLHTGYTDEAATEREKEARNIRVAEAGVAELVDPTPAELAANLVNLGRAYTCAGRNEDALGCYERVIALDAPVRYRRAALTHGFEAHLADNRFDEAEEWLALLRDASTEANVVPRYFEGLLLFRRGDVEGALERLVGIETLADDEGTERGPEFVAKVRGMAHLAKGEWEPALESFLLVATSGGDPPWGPMAVAATMTSTDLSAVTAFVTPANLLAACAEIVSSLPFLAPAFLEPLWERFPGDARLLGAAARLGPRISVGRALDWSARLRAAGAPERCPLRAIVAEPAAPAAERLRAAAVLEAAFGERQPDEAVAAMAAGLVAGEEAAVGAELSQLCPRLGAAIAA